ncbi:RDD family protein [Streptomyces sp. NPDC102270]|uniref:RDD family protein n=1 Tax=Streptomyces sp. NPDC102270 TaxID=3366150 RepID=UPI0037F2DF61
MSAPTPAPGDDRPREGYYPDPSIPGYVRYWNGASWVPGTSRPAPAAGEPLAPPAGAGSEPGPSPVEETGPHFFDEDPAEEPPHPDTQHGSRPEPASAWAADRAHQGGFGGEQDRRVSWGSPQAAAQAQGIPHQGAQQGPQGAQHGAPQTPRGADPRVPGPGRPEGHAARTDGTATIPPVEPDEDGGTRVFRRPTAGSGGAGAAGAAGAARQSDDDGTMKFRAVSPRTAQQGGGPGAQSGSTPGPAYAGPVAQGGQGAGVQPSTAGVSAAAEAPGFGAGKAAAERAAAAGSAGPQGPASAPAPSPQGVPQQGGGPQQAVGGQPVGGRPVGVQPAATPMSPGPGGGQPSWAQQVHRLAGPDEEQPVPWKPPVEDIFQAAARRQASARPAGLGKRLAARLLDTLVVGAVTAVAAVPLGAKAADHINEKIDAAKLSGETVTVWLLDGTTSVYLGIVVAVLLVAGILYEALPTAKWGRTLGKKLFGLEVRDIEGHEPPSFSGALRRWLVYSVPGLLGIGLVGVAWCLFDRPWRQCWHDKAAHTFVAG